MILCVFWVFFQVNVKYNIPLPKEKPSFYLDINVKELKTTNCEHKIQICGRYGCSLAANSFFKSNCRRQENFVLIFPYIFTLFDFFSFTKSGKSNMALIDVNMVSGFIPIVAELDVVMQSSSASFSFYEFIDGVLSFYFNEVSINKTVSLIFHLRSWHHNWT